MLNKLVQAFALLVVSFLVIALCIGLASMVFTLLKILLETAIVIAFIYGAFKVFRWAVKKFGR